MTVPIWQTPAGFLGTVTQQIYTSTHVSASGDGISYDIINGKLPSGLLFSSTGTIYGRPFSIGQPTYSQFTVRASNSQGVSDQTFNMLTVGHVGPEWITPSGLLAAGLFGTYYTLNEEFVDYQLNAHEPVLPTNGSLTYYIGDNDGTLPSGLTLLSSGRITGQIKDVLLINYLASAIGGYDEEPYDEYPYDHVGLSGSTFSTTPRYIPKTYQFYVSVTDGTLISRQYFAIKVEDPNNFRVDNTFIDVDTTAYSTDSDYLLAPQWLTPANLGVVKANNNLSIKLSVYDFESYIGPVLYDWLTPVLNQDGSPSIRPPNFNLDPNTGVLYAAIPYQPAFNLTYSFTVNVVKVDIQTKNQNISPRTFTITIKGVLNDSIKYLTTSTVGTITPGYISELSIKAEYVYLESPLLYTLVSGQLPPGLTLADNGDIQGRVSYRSVTCFDGPYGPTPTPNFLILDGGETTIDKYWNFVVGIGDIYQNGVSTSSFRIAVVRNDLTKYTQIYAQPLLPKGQRSAYKDFINNSYTFDPAIMYRPNDSYFGIQQKLQLYIEFGIEQSALDNYFTETLVEYFSRRRFFFGNVSYSQANDSQGNYVYDIVYVTIIDQLSNGSGPTGPININGHMVYLNNILNMKSQFENMLIKGSKVKTDEYQLPRFMRTIQISTGNPLGYVTVAPLCYVLPGNGATIVEKIAQSGFDFTNIDFSIDRFILQDNLTYSGAKYLMFPTKDNSGNNLGQGLSYVTTSTTDGYELFTEDGYNIYLE
jgi:hypothetical protein